LIAIFVSLLATAVNQAFSTLPQRNVLIEGTPGAAIHPSIPVEPSDVIVTKRRFGAFSTTGSCTTPTDNFDP
jgi:nicotinamidase-related amidase